MVTVTIPSATGTVANDTWKLQTLANSLPSSGGTISLPADSDYTINSPLLLKSNVILEGNNCRLIANNALNNSVIRNSQINLGNENIRINNLRIAGNRTNQSHTANPAHGIAFYSSCNILVENVTIDDVELDGVYFGGTVASTISSVVVGSFCSNVVVRNCTITNCYRNGVSLTNTRYAEIYNITASANNKGVPSNSGRYLAATIDLEPNDGTDHCFEIYIHNNNITADNAPAIAIQGSSNKDHCYIYSNTIDQTTNKAISVLTPINTTEIYSNTITCHNAGAIWYNGQGSSILNANIHNNTLTGDDTALLAGIGLGYVTTNTPVLNNVINDFAKAVLLSNVSVATINNNTFHSCAVSIDSTTGSSYTESGNIIT